LDNIEQRQHTVFARVADEDYELLVSIAKSRREALSTLVRRALLREMAHLNYLSEEERKALGELSAVSPKSEEVIV